MSPEQSTATNGAAAALVHQPRDHLLAGAGLAEQQHRSLAGCHPRDELEHLAKARCTSGEPLRRGCCARPRQRLHALDEIPNLPRSVAHWVQFDLHVLVAPRRVMDVQRLLGAPGNERRPARARLAGLVAGRRVVMRNLVAVATDHGAVRRISIAVRLVRGEDPVVEIRQDSRLAKALDERDELRERFAAVASHVSA